MLRNLGKCEFHLGNDRFCREVGHWLQEKSILLQNRDSKHISGTSGEDRADRALSHQTVALEPLRELLHPAPVLAEDRGSRIHALPVLGRVALVASYGGLASLACGYGHRSGRGWCGMCKSGPWQPALLAVSKEWFITREYLKIIHFHIRGC